MSVIFDEYGFFNGTWELNQVNWAKMFSPVVPDGVMAGIGGELEVYADSAGMTVHVRAGECRVRGHRGALESPVNLTIAAADSVNPRIDLVIVRVTYGSPSEMMLDVLTGTAAENPVAPEVTQTAGNVWEIPLARVAVAANATTIAVADVIDARNVYKLGATGIIGFAGTSLSVANDMEYRSSEESIGSLTIELPTSPSAEWMCAVNFTAGADFTGVAFTQGGEAYTVKTADSMNYTGKRYNMIIWWDGAFYWVASKAV